MVYSSKIKKFFQLEITLMSYLFFLEGKVVKTKRVACLLIFSFLFLFSGSSMGADKDTKDEAIALKIANDKFYFIVDEEVTKYKETSCKETIEKMKKSENKGGIFEVYYSKDGALWSTQLPTANCMKTAAKHTPFCNTKLKQKSKLYDSRHVSIKDGVIKLSHKVDMGGDNCDVDLKLKLNGHNSTMTRTYGGAKCSQLFIDTFSNKGRPAKLCEGEFDLQQHVDKNSQTKVNSFANPKLTKNEIINLLDIQKWAYLNGALCDDEHFQVFSTKKGHYQSVKGNVSPDPLDKIVGISIDESNQAFTLEQQTFFRDGLLSAKKKILGKVNANGTLFVRTEAEIVDFNSVGSGNLKYKSVTNEQTLEPCKETNKTSLDPKTLLKDYGKYIARKIGKLRKYPFSARRKGIQGRVIIELTILKTGELENLKVIASPNNILTKSSIAAIQQAAPFPKFPKEINQESIKFKMPFKYHLN